MTKTKHCLLIGLLIIAFMGITIPGHADYNIGLYQEKRTPYSETVNFVVGEGETKDVTLMTVPHEAIWVLQEAKVVFDKTCSVNPSYCGSPVLGIRDENGWKYIPGSLPSDSTVTFPAGTSVIVRVDCTSPNDPSCKGASGTLFITGYFLQEDPN